MRWLAAILFSAHAWATSCNVPPPCLALSPGLIVLLAEAAETRLADPAEQNDLKLVPVRMKLRTLLYGQSPGDEFTFHASAVDNVRAGDVFYIEAPSSNEFRITLCGISGPYYESSHAPRVKYFREYAAGKHRDSTFRIQVIDQNSRHLPGVTAVLTALSGGPHRTETDTRGQAEWKSLQPGRHNISLKKQDYSVFEPEEALAAVEIPAGGCPQRQVYMHPRFNVKGIVRTPDGKPAKGVNLRMERLSESASAQATTDVQGLFTISRVAPGDYTLIAGDDRDNRNPYPTTYYPGVPNRELSQRLSVGQDQPEAFLQLTIPRPAPTRTIVLKFESTTTEIYPTVVALTGTIFEQDWSATDSILTAVVSATGPLHITASAWRHGTSVDWLISPELTIPPGTASLPLTVHLSPSPAVRNPNPE